MLCRPPQAPNLGKRKDLLGHRVLSGTLPLHSAGRVRVRASFTLHIRFRQASSTLFDLYLNHRSNLWELSILCVQGTYRPHLGARREPSTGRVECLEYCK